MTALIVAALSVALGSGAVPPQATSAQTPPKPVPQSAPKTTPQAPPAQQATKPPATAQPGAKPQPAAGTPPGTAAKPPQPAAPGTSPAAPKPSQAAASPAPTAAGGRLALLAFVTDPAGKPIAEVKVSAIGPVTREGASDKDGVARLTALRAGTYRVRFESKETITFEREAVLKAGPTTELEVTLNPAPPSAPPPAAPQPLSPPPAMPLVSDGQHRFELLSLPDWIERNYIGRNDPLKEGRVGDLAAATATVLQVRDPIKDRLSRDTDELLYVIAGDGVVTVGGRQESVTAGWLIVIPRGTPSAVERRGRNPLIVLVVSAPAKR